MVEMFYSLLLIGTGVVGLYFSVMSLLNPAFAEKYAERGPKAWLGRKIFGTDNLSTINRRIFLPLGVAISFGLILIGVLIWV